MTKRVISIVVTVLVCAALCAGFTGCGGGKTSLYVYNWGEYIDEDVLDLFEEEYPQYKVVYDTFDTNEAMYQKVVSKAIPYDVLIPSDYMIKRMINEGLLNEIDTSSLKNYSNIRDSLKGAEFDPDEKYSVPYVWGTLGILYNTKLVDGEIDSWGVLFDEKYNGQILMLDSVRDTMGFALKYLGYSMNSTNEAEINEARDLLLSGKHLYADWGVDTNKDPMKNGSYAMTVTWSGDAMDLMSENEDLDYVIPKEGGNVWIDSMVIPVTSKNTEGAKLFIDFMCRTDIAKMNAEEIGYSTPSDEVLEELGDEYINDPVFNPGEDELAKCETFIDLGDDLKYYNAAWEKIRLA